MAAFPSSPGSKDIEALEEMKDSVKKNLPKFDWKNHKGGKPLPVDAPAIDRMREELQNRNLCVYDEKMQTAPVIHFMCYHKMRIRYLTHFYTFLFFEDWKQGLWTKRFVRDHLRYVDELQCAAARVVEALRDRARKLDPSNPDGLFDTMHIRRGDFQFKTTRMPAEEIYANSKDVLKEKSVLYISTDERNKTFFKPFAEHYDVCFLDEFQHLFKRLNTNYYGMLEQLIASKGRVFVGTMFSTFTGFINRMRGYYVDKHKLRGHENGTMPSYYFGPLNYKDEMINYVPFHGPYWQREYPSAWRDIDQGIEELYQSGVSSVG